MTVNTDCSVLPAVAHGVVEFDPAAFRALFPVFTDPPTTDAQLQFYFALATLVLSNSCASVVTDGNERERLFYLLVAHIATLFPLKGGAGAGVVIVGPLSGATEGTVTVQAGWAASVGNNAAWYAQTQYGFMFWQFTAPYRSMRYVLPRQCCGPAGVLAGRRG